MKKYILGKKTIETTEEIYNNVFKELGYVPYKEKIKKTTEKTEKPVKKVEE